MSDPQKVPVVGGPLDGETWPYSSSQFLLVPDGIDTVTVVRDGEAMTLFGEHTYEMKCYANSANERKHQWEYVGYKPPIG